MWVLFGKALCVSHSEDMEADKEREAELGWLDSSVRLAFLSIQSQQVLACN